MLEKAAAIATILALPLAAYQILGPTSPTSQPAVSGHAQAADQVNAETAERLIKALPEQYPDAAFPSTLQALGPAIKWAEQSTAQGDNRIQRARESVKEGNTKEALTLFEAIAADKAARSEQAAELAKRAQQRDEKDREEAALAYRYLGVFASLADPQRALQAYEKALEYNPKDLVSLVGSGMILQVSHGDLDKAKARLEYVLKLAKTEDQALILCAQLCLGDIDKQRGKFSHALKYYQKGLATAEEQLTKAGPRNERWKFYVGIANECLGDLEMAKEKPDYPVARKFYQARYETITSLVASDNGNPVWQRDLSISHQKIGNVQLAQNDLDGAMESYGKSRDIIEPLAESHPENMGWQRDLAASYEKIGGVLEAKGEHEAALKYFRDSHDIIEGLAKSDPDNRGWKRDLSVSYNKIGGALEAKGDIKGALKSYQDGLTIAQGLALSDPGNARWQLDLAESLSKIAHVYEGHDAKKARGYLQQAKAIRARLTKFSPDNADWKQELDQFDRDMTALAPS